MAFCSDKLLEVAMLIHSSSLKSKRRFGQSGSDQKTSLRVSGPPRLSSSFSPQAPAEADLSSATVVDGFQPSLARVGFLALGLLGGSTAVQASVQTLERADTSPLRQRLEEVFSRKRQRRRVLETLDSLELSGRLERTASDGTTLLENLEKVSVQELGPRVDRKELLEKLLTHLTQPERMTQGDRGTCAPTGIQHVLADRYPAEYVRLVSGLASPQGSVTTANGESLVRVERSIKDKSGRDLPSRLIQSALMDYGNGSETYDHRKDWHTGEQDQIAVLHQANPWVEGSGHLENGHPGLYPNEVTRVLRAVLPGAADTYFVNPERSLEHLNNLRGAHQRGETVVVGLKWRDSAHLLVVKEVAADHLVLWNPWGQDNLEEQPGPERKLLNKHGRVRIDNDVIQERLQVYEIGGKLEDSVTPREVP